MLPLQVLTFISLHVIDHDLDSGVKNLTTKTNTSTNASLATDDTFDEELDIDVEEVCYDFSF